MVVNDKGNFDLSLVATPLHLKATVSGGQNLVFMSGTAEVNFEGVSDGLNDLTEINITFIPTTPPNGLAPRWVGIPLGVPVVSLADIKNGGQAINARWSILSVNGGMLDDRFQITVRIGVNDTDGVIVSLSYFVTLLGTLVGGEGGAV